QAADPGVVDLGVVERLGLVVDRLAVDALAVLGVVLDLDREIAADGFDEHAVENVEMRMAAVDHHVASGADPLEVVRRRQRDVALAAVVDIAHLAVGRDRPAEHTQVGDALADLERGQQLAVAHDQLDQPGVLVVRVQLAEIVGEAVDAEEAALELDRSDVVALRPLHQLVQREHVGDRG
ncbi:hypothetical protein CATMIT_01936, partial [Catenibacterium mitsuokai DSM 15897]